MNLNGKTAAIAGGTGGIGLASAITMSKLGATVILMARNEEKLKKTLPLLSNSENQEHRYLVADFSNSESLDNLCENLKNIQVDILLNNTGGPAGGPITEAKPEEFIHTFQQHLIANHKITQAVLGNMKNRPYGRIINVISTSVKAPLNGLGVSNTIRGAVANWAKTMANELGQYNITVNNVLPGATNTGRLNEIFEAKSKKTRKSISEIKKGMESIVPMNRIAEPEEVANAIAFLASSLASYINGINLPVDGGRTPCL